ncbi:MAG: UDP-N-acetylmuramate dehydrogenase [Geminicoccaceae bacterium]|nr:UDP-N-acetylmuramate dehydrogenase [Geminicoccaceae bacterium]MCS7268556.1 UDP-N-acetylmuramate dehydrogenase [Geminicoccaceae bacterium]MCX7629037.1 UDP-N-acetylmuramate dehydrogenase [Geminicoccaceae bacterium]MDW8123840.1 UDP-N-acetylmuramate dehydrogenase [Geminicoccaceae bacterium]MDW8341182.1 UDP-N-acetylmuramate dehydrogenase [Geminicoccaceae bacterium]
MSALATWTPPRGVLRANVPLAPLTWFRVGGPARLFFRPADLEELRDFRRALDGAMAVFPMGAASNLLVRDGGIDAAVVRLGGVFARIEVEGTTLVAGAGARDAHVAREACRAGLSGLEFFVGVPGTIGGAVRMNAGAFGGETADRLLWAELLDREGRIFRLSRDELGFGYRESRLPEGAIVLRAAFALVAGDPRAIRARMEAIRSEREANQPQGVATGGSTFKNPPGEKAWRLIEAAGCRGLRLGAAMVSEKHCNFLVNTGGARAAELEALGELVRARVRAHTGVALEWEILRVGEPGTAEDAP